MASSIKKDAKFKEVPKNVDFIDIEHQMLKYWKKDDTFKKLVQKNKGNKHWSFLDGPITANNPMGVHHAWGRTLKDVFQRFHALKGYDMRYQNEYDILRKHGFVFIQLHVSNHIQEQRIKKLYTKDFQRHLDHRDHLSEKNEFVWHTGNAPVVTIDNTEDRQKVLHRVHSFLQKNENQQ